MNLRLLFIYIIILLFSTSCAYYNTFHNTKKIYKEAKKEREKRKGEKPSSAEIKQYDLTIEKASKILEIYPESKYVDDAVLILGECFYYKGDYIKAQRKFEELILYFPDSDYYYKAKLWLAKTNIQVLEYLSARYILLELIAVKKIDRDIRDESRFLLAEVQLKQGNVEEAEKGFRKVAEDSKNKLIKSKTYLQLGLSQINTQKYTDAVKNFQNAIKYSQTKQFEFDAELNLARALKLSGEFNNAKNVCFGLLDNELFKDKHGLVKLEIADCIYREGKSLYNKLKSADLSYLGKVEEAIDEYKKITLEYKRTENSASAYFQMAKIYENDFGDFTSAKENYEKVKMEFGKSEHIPESIEKAKNIGDLIRMKELIKKSQGLQFSENNGKHFGMTELELLLLEHGVHPELRLMKKMRLAVDSTQSPQLENQTNPPDKVAAMEPKNEDLEALLTNKLQLAEVYLFQFGQLDSAISEYNEIISLFPDHPGTAKAFLSYAYIYENEYHNKFKTDSLLYELIERYPDSYQAQEARKTLQLPPIISQVEQAAKSYKQAENTLFTSKNTRQAVNEFQQVVENFPSSEYAPKALYAIGWIHERLTFENDKAIKIYQDILKNYPASEYSKKVKKKITEVDKAATALEAEKLKETQTDTLSKNNPNIEPETVQKEQQLIEAAKTNKNDKKFKDPESADKDKNKSKKQNLNDLFE